MIDSLLLVHPDAEMCSAFEERFGDLTNIRVFPGWFEELPPHDCFVTAGNAFGIMTAGIDAAVVHYFGQGLMDEVQRRIMNDYFGEQPVGTAFIVASGNERIPFVAHAPTMRVPGDIRGTDKVYSATWAALLAIVAHNVSPQQSKKIKTVAMPAMGTGFGGVPFDEAARQMAAAYRHLLEPPHRLDWDFVAERHHAICYDDDIQVCR